MKTLQLRDAKAAFSAVVEAAERGDPTVITKHGRPVAMLVPIDKGRDLYASGRPSFADHLLAIPHRLDVARDPSPPREPDL